MKKFKKYLDSIQQMQYDNSSYDEFKLKKFIEDFNSVVFNEKNLNGYGSFNYNNIKEIFESNSFKNFEVTKDTVTHTISLITFSFDKMEKLIKDTGGVIDKEKLINFLENNKYNDMKKIDKMRDI